MWRIAEPSRAALLAALLAVGAACPSTASAQIPTLGGEDCDAGCSAAWILGGIGGAALAVGEAWLLIDGIIKYGHGHGLWEEAAAIEVFLGLAHLAPVAASTWALLTDDDPDDGFVALGYASGVLGAYFLVHGLWSLGGGRPPPSHFAIGAAPAPGGASVSLSGIF